MLDTLSAPQLEDLVAGSNLILYGLLAGWLVAGQPKLLYRALVTIVLLTLPLRIGAMEVFIAHLAQVTIAVMIFLCVRIILGWQRSSGNKVDHVQVLPFVSKQFSLRDALLFVLALAVAVDNARRAAPIAWEACRASIEIGITAGAITGPAFAVPTRLKPAALYVLILLPVNFALGKFLHSSISLTNPMRLLSMSSDAMALGRNWESILPGVGMLTAFLAFQARRAGLLCELSSTTKHLKSDRSLLAAGLFVALTSPLVIGAALFFAELCIPLGSVPIAIPDQNKFEELSKATESLDQSKVTTDTWDTNTVAEMQAFVAANEPLINRIRGASRGPIRTPIIYGDSDSLMRTGNLRAACQALLMRARLFNAEGDSQAAASCRMDLIELGRNISNSGLIIDMLVGIAYQQSGEVALSEQLVASLPTNAIDLIRRLKGIEQNKPNFEQIAKNDREWTIRSDRWWSRFSIRCEEIAGRDEQSTYRKALRDSNCRLQVLLAELAIRQFRQDHNRLPSSLSKLVPEYLKTVPTDFYRDQPLIYRMVGDDFLVYSVGSDQVDDGGRPVDWSNGTNAGDLLYPHAPSAMPHKNAPPSSSR